MDTQQYSITDFNLTGSLRKITDFFVVMIAFLFCISHWTSALVFG